MAFLRSVTTIGLFTLLSRALGFVRDLLIASFLGAGPVADAFVVAQRLPNAFRGIFAEGAMDTAFVPIYSRKRQRELPESVQDFTNHIFTILLIILLPLVGIGILFMPRIVLLLAPGFDGDMQRLPLAISYSNITFSYLILISLASLQGGLLNANGRFGPYASAPAIVNLAMILGFGFSAWFNLDPALIGSWALIIGGFAQLFVLYLACRRNGLSLHFARPRWTVDVRQFFKLVGPGIVGMCADQFNIMVMTIVASTLPSGAIAALYYADRLNQLPLGVIGGAVATALLPALTRHISAKEDLETTRYFSRAIEITLMLCVPASVALLVMPTPIVQMLFQHGVFNADDTRTTVETIMGYAPTIPGSVLVRIFTVRFFAHENTRVPVLVSLFSILFNIALTLYLKTVWQHFGIAFAYSITMWMNASLLWIMMKVYGYAKVEKNTWSKLPRIAIAGVALCGVLMLSERPAEAMSSFIIPGGVFHLMIGLVIRGTLGCAAYLAVLMATGVARISDFRKMLKAS